MRMEDDRLNSRLTEQEQAPFAVCPACGARMVRAGKGPAQLVCEACGEVQQIEALSSEASERQMSYLHDRGIDRMRAAFRSGKELP